MHEKWIDSTGVACPILTEMALAKNFPVKVRNQILNALFPGSFVSFKPLLFLSSKNVDILSSYVIVSLYDFE